MADLSDIQAAQSVKLVGASTTGLEATPVRSTGNGDMGVADVINTAALSVTLSVTNVAQECKVGATTLANRKLLVIQAQGTGLTYGFSSSSQPFNLPNGTTLTVTFGPNVSIWVRRTTAAAVSVVVGELA